MAPARGLLLAAAALLATVAGFPAASAAEDPATRPTSFVPVGKSLKELLDGGYDIVTMSAGLGGYAYLLKHDRQWVTCALQPAPDDPKSFVSQCMKMN